MAFLLEIAQQELGWPSREEIFSPGGAGPRVLAELADRKIGSALRRLAEGDYIRAGVLVSDPTTSATGAPLAVVCEFQHGATPKQILEAHRLAWNFSRAPLLVTAEPHLLRVWTCFEIPEDSDQRAHDLQVLIGEHPDAELERHTAATLSGQAAAALHWVNLITGAFVRRHPDKFDRDRRADRTLLANLRYVRAELHSAELDYDTIHDLLARIIFIQFLMDRKDSTGRSALNEERLLSLHREGVLSSTYASLGDILADYQDAYSLFRHLDERFNGDLFPGKGDQQSRQEAWAAEQAKVTPDHLKLLARFISGRLAMGEGQYSLWRLYSFDAIPLEFISSIYEEFVAKRPGVVYTPGFLVDLVLDAVLPWDGTEWDLKILDPACGSGIFLVKAFQRLVHRWKNAHPGAKLEARQLRQILERNVFGVDSDEHAVRVASFSLYLAMCDEIDPKHYWQQVKFPQLRNQRIVWSDFFKEAKGFRTVEDARTYDLVIGNVPWSSGSIEESPAALEWGQRFCWRTFDKDIGPLFLPKAAALTKESGRIGLLQPASLLFSTYAIKFRVRLFSEFDVEEVVNLSAVRHELFPRAVAPACLVTLQPTPGSRERIPYISPKPTRANNAFLQIAIEPNDIAYVSRHEAASDPVVWAALAWGGRRDLMLLRRLASSAQTLAKLRSKGIVKARNGIMRGKATRKYVPELEKRLFLKGPELPVTALGHLRTSDLSEITDAFMHTKDQTNLEAFETPQVILKRSWNAHAGRFQAALVNEIDAPQGVVCSQNFVSAHVPLEMKVHAEAACLTYNSLLAVYYLLLTSGRIASYRPNLRVGELLRLPYPEPRQGLLDNLRNYKDVDKRVRVAFELDDVEWALVEDLHDFTMPDFQRRSGSPARKRTRKLRSEGDEHLLTYASYYLRVLKAGLGDVAASVTIFQTAQPTSVRLIAIHLDWPGREDVVFEEITSTALLERLTHLNNVVLKTMRAGIQIQRVARVYSSIRQDGRLVPTVFLIKPDEIRYWTRSVALRDADETVADALMWTRSIREVASGHS